MKVAVWGAGTIGAGLAYRLTTTAFVSELLWINRDFEKIDKQVIDIGHGLAFAPTCHTVRACAQPRAATQLRNVDALVLALGAPVEPGQTREDKYEENARILDTSVIPALEEYDGVVLMITNPVDLMARHLFRRTGLSSQKVLGLGTVVETARLRSSLGSYLFPRRPAREIWAYAVGTHDQRFVAVAGETVAVGDDTPADRLKEIVSSARDEVARAAERVKTNTRSSLHPIVEGAVEVLGAIARDQRSMLTVSTLDPDSSEELFYSMPCTIGRQGLLERFDCARGDEAIGEGIAECREAMLEVLRHR